MTSRTYALIDGTSRRNYYENQGNANLGYWDDPSYYNPPSKLRSNTEAYKDTVLEKNLLEPQKFGTPYLSHDEITRTVSKQFASDIKERSYASSGSGGRSNFALVFVASALAAMGVMDLLAYVMGVYYVAKADAPLCLDWDTLTNTYPAAMVYIVWLWITAGIWASILPLILGFIGECSKQSSNADYVHTFDPVLRMDSSNGQNGKTEKLYNTLIILSIIILILGFICAIIDCVLFSGCVTPNSFPMKYIPSILVCLLCIAVLIILLVLWRSRKRQAGTNSNYDRRDYDLTLNYGLYYDNKSSGGNVGRQITTESTMAAPVATVIPAPPLQSQPLVTIVDQTPAYPVIPPPPPSARPLGPPIFAGAPRLPVRAMPYQRPMMYQMPAYNY